MSSRKNYKNKYDVERDEDKQRNAEIAQDADQFTSEFQDSDELIIINDSCNISVETTETKAAVSLQIALQLAIALVIKITIADSDDSDSVVQDLLQHFKKERKSVQKIHIDNSKDISIKTTDTDIAVNIQVMLEALLAIVARLDIA